MPTPRTPAPGGDAPSLVPCLMISKGRIMLPAEGGPAPASKKDGGAFDLFEIADRLMADYDRLYVVDLDAIDRNQPQLDYLQEIAQGGEIWVDAGVRNADQAIDVLVAGAQRAILSTAFLHSEKELRRAWRLSSDLVFEVEVRAGAVAARSEEWNGRPPADVASAVRAEGPTELVLSYRESAVDWSIARAVARDGPLWIDGSFELSEAPRLRDNGCRGGIFHLHQFLSQYESPLPGA
jgi:phosphoribosylformimino-5-aminoimidazole carboxamide ribonucleotide (ProFAR) isomerase